MYRVDILGFFAWSCSCLQDVGILLVTEFSKKSIGACAVELLFGVVAQLGVCSSITTEILLTAPVTAWWICTCVVCLKEKKGQFSEMQLSFR